MKKALLWFGITKKIALIAVFLISSNANADQLFGDFKRLPDDIERGFSVSADAGIMVITGKNRTLVNPGYQLSLNIGYDFSQYVSIGVNNILAIHEADPFDSALEGGVNSYFHDLVARLQYPLSRWFAFFEVGAGIYHSTPSFNFDDDSYKWNINFALGMEYYTFLRHYSLYVKTHYHYILDAPINAWGLSTGLKYTF